MGAGWDICTVFKIRSRMIPVDVRTAMGASGLLQANLMQKGRQHVIV